MTATARGANGMGGVIVLAAITAMVSAHEVLLPSSFGVLPQHVVPLPSLPPLHTVSPPVLFRTGLDFGLNLEPTTPSLLPAAPVTPVVPDHVTPVLRAGAPAILLLPQTPSSGVYHLSDSHHQFPPFLENVVNRVQNLFSSYVQTDPFNVPFATSRPTAPTPAPSAASTAAPGSTAAITTTTTTTTTAQTQGRGINVRLLASAPGGSSPTAGLPRDVELLDGRLQQQQQQVSASPGRGQPVAFASATAQVHQPDGEADSYRPPNNNSNNINKNEPIDQKPPPPGTRPPSRPPTQRPPYGYRGPPPQRPQRPGPHPVDPSYYRRP